MTHAHTRARTLTLRIALLAGLLALAPFAARPATAEGLTAPGSQVVYNPKVADLVVYQSGNLVYYVDVVVKNQGTASTGPFTIRYQSPLKENTFIRHAGLAPGESIKLKFFTPALFCGTASVIADIDNVVIEQTEANNTYTEYVCISF